jgi:hypothetical protein
MNYELIDTLREDLDSDIWAMPPVYYRVWLYLRCLAYHKEISAPLSGGTSITLLPGQCITTLREIAASAAWFERGILKVPNVRSIDDILCWMEEQDLIEIEHGKSSSPILPHAPRSPAVPPISKGDPLRTAQELVHAP